MSLLPIVRILPPIVVVCASTLAVGQQSGVPQYYEVTDLGGMGGTYAWARAISNNGIVGGAGQTLAGAVNAFVWQQGTMNNLGTFGGGKPTADVYGINEAGQAVGHAYDSAAAYYRAFVSQGNSLQLLSTLNGDGAAANAINNSGTVAGWSDDAAGVRRAVIWTNGLIQQVNPSTGKQNSYATGINDAGHLVGSAFNTASQNSAWFWAEGQTVTLPAAPSRSFATAHAVNEADWAVGISWTRAPTADTLATLWIGGQATELGTVGNYSISSARGINNAGQVVGDLDGYGLGSAFLWSDGTMYDLNALLPAGSDIHIVAASDINDAGVIIAQGRTASGQYHPILLTPVPEPASAALAALAGLLGLRRRPLHDRRGRAAE